MDLKEEGNLLLLVGETKDELGGSHFNLVTGNETGTVPQVDLAAAPKTFKALHECIQAGAIRSCHDLSEGGLAVSIAEMAFAGGFGVDIQLQSVGDKATVDLFSESNTRFIVEVPQSQLGAITEAFEKHESAVPIQLGKVSNSGSVTITDSRGDILIQESIVKLKSVWQQPLATF